MASPTVQDPGDIDTLLEHRPSTIGTDAIPDDSETVAEEIRDAHTITMEPVAFARGGHADVFRGHWVPPGKTEPIHVAIKVLRFIGMSGATGEKERMIRFDKRLGREVRVWERLRHPGRIVPLLGYMRSGNGIIPENFPCLVSPYYPHTNLSVYLEERPNADRLKLLTEAAEGLSYLHSLNPPIVHLDIKSQNILINHNDEAEICDFGVSRILDGIVTGLTTSGNAVGIFNYACPEALDNEKDKLTPAADVWSFACLVLDILSGNPPFYKLGTSPLKITLAIGRGKTASRDDHEIKMPPKSLGRLWSLFEHCWQPDTLERPPMSQVIVELKAIRG